ncbi:DegT/DnrJ/EryC1/StrS family aminotransferase [Streptosporangium oxazolinicum]|uniref:DegT/DnrJ/EryC1/StrS family aminotransferase n=1 Tax=Streptosporangium oxazolinicum TaxID=909287 RepID=A0ABP8B4T1_9ACTN
MIVGRTSTLAETLLATVERMPSAAGGPLVAELEKELATAFGTAHAVAVSSGTAALHTALVAAGTGPGDEVLVPAVCVPMTLAAVIHCGARPIPVDCDESGFELDYDDLSSKLTARTRAVLPVHLAGRCLDLRRLANFAGTHGLALIEDACQAQGSIFGDRFAGTHGTGCFSLKDGKILWAGEGGYVLTNDAELADTARRFRTHGQVRHSRAGTRFGHNYRMPELTAALAQANLRLFPQLLARRRRQTALLAALLDGLPGVVFPFPAIAETWNGYAPIFRLALSRPRELCLRLAHAGVPNSVGTFGLISADQLPAMVSYGPAPCPRARESVDRTLAVVIQEQDDDERIRQLADTITREVRQWA